MRTHLVWDKAPQPGNGRNSEGAFLKAHNGNILYAYNRYSSDQWGDDASCDIAMIRSCDEGETWGEPEIIVHAADFQVENIMSPTGLEQNNGDLAFYFHIKEHNGTNTFGRAISKDDGFTFASSRCICDFIQEYYVSNNDRAIRLSDGSIVIPVAMHSTSGNFADFQKHYMDSNAVSMCLVSLDDGASFTRAPARVMLPVSYNDSGMQEPGLIEKKNGVLWLYARTTCGYQYQCFSFDGMRTFTPSVPSLFTSPCSPLKISRGPDDALYAVYNPIPNYNGRKTARAVGGRTPLVIRKSTDDGITFGPCNVIESDEDRGYCYPSMFFTGDESVLVAYCRGSVADGSCLVRLGINKINLQDIEG